jgi:O-antigen/teichoic acid export membrane protein
MRLFTDVIRKLNMRRTGLLRDAALAFFVRGLGAVATFLMSLAVARAIPIEQAGYFFLAITVIQILAPIGLLGTNVASLRFIGGWAAEKDWERSWAAARTTWMWAGSFLAAISLLIGFSSRWVSIYIFSKPAFGEVLCVIAPGIFLMGCWMLLAAQLQAIHRIAQSIFVLSICAPIGVAAGAWLLPMDSAVEVAGLYVSAGLLPVGLGIYWWWRNVPSAISVSIDRKALLQSCMPLWIIAVVGTSTHWASQLVAGVWVGAEEVAYLAVAQRTANLVSFILIALNFVVAPRFAALYKQGRLDELRRLSLRSVRLMYLFGMPLLLLLCLFPGAVMSLFGEGFGAAAPLLIILSIGQFINVVSGSVAFLLTMSGNEKDMRNVVLLTGPFAIVAALILTPLYGITGAAVATAIAVSLQNLGAVWFVRKRLGFNTLVFWQRI